MKAKHLIAGEGLVEGLNHHERIARLEHAWRGYNGHGGLLDTQDAFRRRLSDLESDVNRLRMPWWLRWLFTPKKPKDHVAPHQ